MRGTERERHLIWSSVANSRRIFVSWSRPEEAGASTAAVAIAGSKRRNSGCCGGTSEGRNCGSEEAEAAGKRERQAFGLWRHGLCATDTATAITARGPSSGAALRYPPGICRIYALPVTPTLRYTHSTMEPDGDAQSGSVTHWGTYGHSLRLRSIW